MGGEYTCGIFSPNYFFWSWNLDNFLIRYCRLCQFPSLELSNLSKLLRIFFLKREKITLHTNFPTFSWCKCVAPIGNPNKSAKILQQSCITSAQRKRELKGKPWHFWQSDDDSACYLAYPRWRRHTKYPKNLVREEASIQILLGQTGSTSSICIERKSMTVVRKTQFLLFLPAAHNLMDPKVDVSV